MFQNLLTSIKYTHSYEQQIQKDVEMGMQKGHFSGLFHGNSISLHTSLKFLKHFKIFTSPHHIVESKKCTVCFTTKLKQLNVN